MERPVEPEVTVSSPTPSKQPKSHIPHSGSRECLGEVVNITPSAAQITSSCKTSLLHSFKAGKLKIKEEPGDEIKDYAETTMNELLGWYGYEHAVHKEDTKNLNLKMFQPANGEKGSRSERGLASSPGGSSSGGDSKKDPDEVQVAGDRAGSSGKRDTLGDKEDPGNLAPREEGTMVTRNQTIVSALNLIPRRPDSRPTGEKSEDGPHDGRAMGTDSDMPSPTAEGPSSPCIQPDDQEDGGAPCGMPETSLCLWCQKPTGDKPFSLKSEDGSVKLFCTDLCFTLCRRASFKKNKVCDWCKNVKNTVTYVDFQDGEQQLQFCSEQCLNQYKMNIFCKETQEHLQSIKTQIGSTAIPPQVTSKQIIITPELWKGYHGEDPSRLSSASTEPSSTTDRIGGNSEATTAPRSYMKDKEKRVDVNDRKHKIKGKSDNLHGERKGSDHRLTVGAASYLGNHGKPRLSSVVNGDMTEQFTCSRNYVDVGKNESKDGFQFSDKYLKSPKKEPLFSPGYPRSISKGSEGGLLGITPKLFPSNPKDRAKHNSSSEGFTFGGYPLGTSPDSELSSTPRSSVTSQVPQTSSGGPHSSSTTALPASHLLSSLGPGLPPWMYNPLLASSMAGIPGYGLGVGAHGMALPARPPAGPQGNFGINIGSSDSNNTHETRETLETPQPAPAHVQGANLPLRPPFPMGLGSAPSNLLGMVPPGLPPLLPMGAALQNSYLPSMTGLGSAGILPPNTLLVPYPVVLPLPVPLPLPIPVPIPCNKDGSPAIPGLGTSPSESATHIKQESDDGDQQSSQTRDSHHEHTCPNHVAVDKAGPGTSKPGAKSCQIACACCQTETKENVDIPRVHSTSSPESYESHSLLDPHSSKHTPSHLGPRSSISSNSDFQNDVIDLSKDKHRSKGVSSLPGLDLNRNSTVLNRSPSSGSDNSTPHYTLGGPQQNVDSAYSARRSLILDAPSMPKERNQHSPGVEKRLFMGGLSSKDHAYGKRRCIRPRIRTK